MEVEVLTNIIKLVALPALGYVVYFVVRMEKCVATIKAQLTARTDACCGRGQWIGKHEGEISENREEITKNHTNIRIIAAHSGLGETLEQ